MLIARMVAALPSLYAFGCYKAGAFFDLRYRLTTRQESPGYFWAAIGLFLSCSALFFLWRSRQEGGFAPPA
jgi:hypothetical protein